MIIVLMGVPGCGKGTQAERISAKYGVPNISTGAIFREEMSKKSDVGLEVENHVNSGRLVPDELVMKMMTSRFSQSDCANGFLLDGFPRTVSQAESLDAHMNSIQQKLTGVISLELSENEAVQRLTKRGREDDQPETIQKRLLVFNDITSPLKAYYQGLGVLKSVDGNKDIETVTRSIFAILDELAK